MPKAKAKVSKKPETKKPTNRRRLKTANYKTFRLSKRIKHSNTKLPNVFKLSKQSIVVLKQNWKLFLGISVVYGFLTLILVRGLSSTTNLNDIKDSLKGTSSGISSAATLFSYLIGSGGSSSEAGGVYQAILIIMVSLASIWALRQVLAGTKIKVRDSFYKGLYPFVPFILVLMVIGLQLIPLLIGNWLYSTIISNGIAVTALEKGVWLLLFLLLAVLSLYMICSSLFALYIVTLPDMTPMKALRSARQLVLHRRWLVLRKILFLPLALIIVAAIIFMPLVFLIPGVTVWIFFVLSMFLLVIIHSYMYNLYRNLL